MFFQAKAFRAAAKQFREALAHAVSDSSRSHDLMVAMKLRDMYLKDEGLWQRDKKTSPKI